MSEPFVWPAGLPQAPLAERYSETLPDTVIRTQMDQGPAKLRQRTTAGVGAMDVAFLLEAAGAALLEEFYRETLGGGTAPFVMPHPRRAVPVTVRFKKAPQLTAESGVHYLARLELEVLP